MSQSKGSCVEVATQLPFFVDLFLEKIFFSVWVLFGMRGNGVSLRFGKW